MTRKMGTKARLLTTLLMAGALSACASSKLPDDDDFRHLAEVDIEDRSPDYARQRKDAVNFFSEAPVTLLETDGSNAFQLKMDAGQEVPVVPIGRINAAPMEFGMLLNQVAEQAGMSWRITGPGKGELLSEEVYLVQRNETMLKSVLDELSELTGSFYRVEGDRIIFSQQARFVARVPRMANSQEILLEGLGNAGAENTFSDKLSGTVSFTATRPAYEAARRLMASLEAGRDMIVYDFWIIERQFNDSSAAGISLSLAEDAFSASVGGSGTDGFDGAMFSGSFGNVSVSAGVEFLTSLGATKTVARPTITMLSGGESSFSTTQSESYVGSVDESVTNVDEGDGDETTETTREEQIETVEVGVVIGVSGAHHGGVISSDFDLDISELLGFTNFADGTRQPQTLNKQVQSHLESRPGDVMVIGGIIRDREINTRNNVTGTSVPTRASREAGQTETIILVRPRLVQIRPKKGASGPGRISVESGVGEIAPEENPISDVIYEEARARDLLDSMKD